MYEIVFAYYLEFGRKEHAKRDANNSAGHGDSAEYKGHALNLDHPRVGHFYV